MTYLKQRYVYFSLPIGMMVVLTTMFFFLGLAVAKEDAFERENAQPSAYWHISVDAGGKASTYLSLVGSKDIPDIAAMRKDLTAGMEESLRCSLDHVRFGEVGDASVSGDGHIPGARIGFVTRLLFKPSALQSRLNKYGSYDIHISLMMPRFSHNRAPDRLKELDHSSILTYTMDIGQGEEAVPDFVVEYGYGAGYLIVLAVAASVVLIVPIFIVAGMRRRSLKLAERDATAAWFGYWRSHRWIVEGLWVVWLILFWTLKAGTFIEYLMGGRQALLEAIVLIIPPGITVFICQYLTRPLWRQVRGISWNRREMLLRGFGEQAAAVLPFVFVIVGISTLFEETGRAMLWFAAAFILLLWGSWMHQKISRTMPRALHGGELYEKINEMAERTGVKIQQIFVMPAQHLQMGNAFAMQGRRVMITDYLLNRLTKSETDCVIAHEIGHVKKHHTLLATWVGFLGIFIACSLVFWIAIRIGLSYALFLIPSWGTDPQQMFAVQNWVSDYLSYPLALLSAILIRYFLSRRFERSADEFAALLTGNPESMITSLVKLSKMNLMPLSWGNWEEKLSTHPATLRRVLRIAKNHRISKDRLSELLTVAPERGKEAGYDIPDDVAQEGLVFSVERKSKMALVNTFVILLAGALIPILLGDGFRIAGLPTPVYAAGVVVVPLMYILISGFVCVWGYRGIGRELAAKLQIGKVLPDASQARFVGLVPEEYPRSYDAHTVWDVGFLYAGEDALVYFGDKKSFRISRKQIVSIAEGPSYPAWVRIPETYIRWSDGGKENALHLHALEGNSIFGCARQSRLLLKHLADWNRGGMNAASMPGKPVDLPLPAFADVKGNHPRTTATLKGLLPAWLLLTFLVFGFSMLLGLDGGVSWYSFWMATWGLIFLHIPLWRYADSPQKTT